MSVNHVLSICSSSKGGIISLATL